jgi:hypothetical protein
MQTKYQKNVHLVAQGRPPSAFSRERVLTRLLKTLDVAFQPRQRLEPPKSSKRTPCTGLRVIGEDADGVGVVPPFID